MTLILVLLPRCQFLLQRWNGVMLNLTSSGVVTVFVGAFKVGFGFFQLFLQGANVLKGFFVGKPLLFVNLSFLLQLCQFFL